MPRDLRRMLVGSGLARTMNAVMDVSAIRVKYGVYTDFLGGLNTVALLPNRFYTNVITLLVFGPPTCFRERLRPTWGIGIIKVALRWGCKMGGPNFILPMCVSSAYQVILAGYLHGVLMWISQQF